MVPTIFGLIVIGACLLMLVFKRPIREFLVGLLISGVFGASEALGLPALGGASLTVPYFFVFFLVLRMLLVGAKRPNLLIAAVTANLWLVLYALYGVVSALIMPRLFEGSIAVFSMRPLPYRTLLTPTSQNITQAFYVVLTACTALAAYVVARLPKGDEALKFGWTVATVLFVVFGLLDLAGFYGGFDVLSWMKNASYTMVSQAEQGVRRISGSFPEPSSFAGFGAVPLLMFSYFWLCDIQGSKSGLFALAIAAMLALSTSSTAFAMVGVVIVMVCVGIVVTPMPAKTRLRKFVTLCGIIAACLMGGVVLAFIMPKFVTAFATVFEAMTVGKAKSQSAIERGTWAAQGFTAFQVSKGLGIGLGSFRSSGIFQAVLGSVGTFGVLTLALYGLKIVQTLLRKVPYVDRRLVIACCIAAMLMVTPQLLASPSADPGIMFAATVGFALGRQKKALLESAAIAAERAEQRYETVSRSGVDLDARDEAPNIART